MGRVAGKTIIVTGGAAGLGEADAKMLAAEGAQVLITDLDEENGARVAGEIGEACAFMKQDVTDPAQWDAAFDLAESRFGKVDVLVNNAGIVIPGSIADLPYEQYRAIMSVNVDGVFLGCQTATKRMGAGGSIINLSSAAGLKAGAGLVAYNTSKAAVSMMTKSIALYCAEARNGIRCNSVHPGTILTPMVKAYADMQEDPEAVMAGLRASQPDGVLGAPDDIGYIVLYLASDESRFCNGGEFRVDGALAIN